MLRVGSHSIRVRVRVVVRVRVIKRGIGLGLGLGLGLFHVEGRVPFRRTGQRWNRYGARGMVTSKPGVRVPDGVKGTLLTCPQWPRVDHRRICRYAPPAQAKALALAAKQYPRQAADITIKLQPDVERTPPTPPVKLKVVPKS